jgi:hypothetical protein
MHANGIGDMLGGLWACKGKQDQGYHVTYVSKHHPWLKLFDGYDTLTEGIHRDAINLNAEYGNECETKARLTRIERYSSAAQTAPAKPELKDPERLRELGKEYAGCVALGVQSVYSNRNWTIHHWNTLAGLLRAARYRPVALHSEELPLLECEQVTNQPPDVVAGLLLNATATVAIDSSIAWVSAMVGTKTFVLTGPTTAQGVFGAFPNVVGIEGALACSGCYWHKPYSGFCDAKGCASLQSIDPRRALDAVDAHNLPQQAERSLLCWRKLAVLRRCLLDVEPLQGEIAEVGVFRGGSAKFMMGYTDAHLHLFDTFQGQPHDDTAGPHKAGDFAETSLDGVADFLGDGKYTLYPGVFPDTAPGAGRFKFVHLDGDTYQTTKAGLDYFLPRTKGIILLDDAGWENTPGVLRAVKDAGLTFQKASEYQAIIHV